MLSNGYFKSNKWLCQPGLDSAQLRGWMMQNPLDVGVMGGGGVDPETAQSAYRLGP